MVMKILGFISLWNLCKWVVLIMFGYALIHAGIPASVICIFLLIRVAIRFVFHCIHFIGILIRYAVMFLVFILLISVIL